MKLLPFDLELAKQGHPIQTRDGRPAKFIAHVPELINKSKRVIYRIDQGIGFCWEHGAYVSYQESPLDLFMVPVPVKKWLNIYNNNQLGLPCDSKEECNQIRETNSMTVQRIACIQIEYTEGQGLES